MAGGGPEPASEQESRSSEEIIGPFLSYISHPFITPTAAVVLISDAGGFEKPLLRKLADKIAVLGYIVIVPDYFKGDVYVRGFVDRNHWTEKHDPMNVVESTKSLVEVLKSKGLSLVGAVGFCWGAKVVVNLAKEDHLKAAIMCHPSQVTVEDIRDVKTPMAILAAEIDRTTPPALVEQYREVLDSKTEVPSLVKIYEGAVHGWVLEYNENNAKEVERAEEANQKVFEWLNMYLSVP